MFHATVTDCFCCSTPANAPATGPGSLFGPSHSAIFVPLSSAIRKTNGFRFALVFACGRRKSAAGAGMCRRRRDANLRQTFILQRVDRPAFLARTRPLLHLQSRAATAGPSDLPRGHANNQCMV